MNPTISILAEIPEDLHRAMRDYLDTHPAWDQDQVFAVALSMFLLHDSTKREVQLFPLSSAIAVSTPNPPSLLPYAYSNNQN